MELQLAVRCVDTYSMSENQPSQELPKQWERRKRTLHIVDIENLVGDDHHIGDRHSFEHALALYADASSMLPEDQVLVGCHPGLVFTAQQILGSRGQIFTGAGEDGADKALLDASDADFIASRYHLVSIGSGDHIFAPLAAELHSRNVIVRIVARSGRLSKDLETVAQTVTLLDPIASRAA